MVTVRSLKLLLCGMMLGLSATAQADNTDDIQAIRTVVNHYFEGVRDGDTDKLKAAFYHQNMDMKALLTIDGKAQLLALSDQAAFADLSKRPDSDYQGKLLSVNVYHPNAAFVTFDFNGMFIDGFQLLKQDGKWRILNKTFVEK